MKKSLLTVAAALLAVFSAGAQLLEVQSMEKVALPEGILADQAMLSPDGQTIALTTMSGTLKLVDRAAGTARTISRTGSMMDLAFTADGKSVVFREASTDINHLRRVAVKTYNIATGATRTISAPSRNLEAVEIAGNTVATVESGVMRARSAANGETAARVSRAVPSIERGRLYITIGGERRLLSPLGTEGMSYLWPSVSPDGSRIAFYAAGYGTYTCRLDGSDLRCVGRLEAPVWYDNEILVGMRTRNNGVITTEGRIIATNLDGTESQVLTDESQIAVLPSASEGRISYTTTDGKMFILNVSK